MSQLTVVRHPLVQHNLSRLRDKHTPPPEFRRLMAETAMLLAYETLSPMQTLPRGVETPLRPAAGRSLAQPLVLVAILRAGLGMLEGLLALAPEAKVGHIGLYRNEDTLNPVRYYVRLPPGLEKSFVVLADPMLATGGSAVEAIDILKTEGARRIQLMTLLSAKEGVRRVQRSHPDVRIVTAAVDPVLNRKGYIVPGLGDAGDRLFGTTG